MSLERRLRRQQQKQNGHSNNNPLSQLTKALGDLKQLQGLGEAAKGVNALAEKLQEAQSIVEELTELRDDLKERLDQVGDIEAELARQRAVFLRFLLQTDLLVGPGNYMEKFLDAEQRYRAEFDVMLLLMKLATWAKEAP